jgi:TolB-like protein/tetratricopeptide (TPR) repeat protein
MLRMHGPIPAYQGDEPYVFICYSHADSADVFEDLLWLNSQGQHIWYDEGISPGAEWSDEVADAIAGCRLFVYCISPNSIDSEHCRRELNYALSLGINVLAVHLEPTEVVRGIALSLGHRQAILRYEEGKDSFHSTLLEALGSNAETEPALGRSRFRANNWMVTTVGMSLLLIFLFWWNLDGDTGELDRGRVVSVPNSIVVLPFENISQDSDVDYLSDGFSDELRDQLGRVEGLRVAARSSSVFFRGKKENAVTIASTLGVSSVVEGHLRRRGESMQVSVQLIEGATGLATWSEVYDNPSSEMLDIQQHVAEQIVSHILGDATSVKVATTATKSASANDLMLLARYYEGQVRANPIIDQELLGEAIELYRQAVKADPESGLAYSRLAAALLYQGNVTAAEAPIFKALTLDPNLSEVQETLGRYYLVTGLPGVGAAWKRAVELNPNNADALSSYAYYLSNIDPPQLESAKTFFRRALALDPLSISRLGDLAVFYGNGGLVEEVLPLIEQAKAMFDGPEAFFLIARLYELIGEIDQSIAWMIKARDLEPENPSHQWKLAGLYVTLGDFDTALQIEPEAEIGILFGMRRYQEVIDRGEWLMEEQPDAVNVLYLMAFAYHVLGQHDNAIAILRSTGIPERLHGVIKRTGEREAYITYLGALSALGEHEQVARLAHHAFDRESHLSRDWWGYVYGACIESLKGNEAEALELIARTGVSSRLPWNPTLKDFPCLRKLGGHPEYESVIADFDARQEALRLRLPLTLAEFSVSL